MKEILAPPQRPTALLWINGGLVIIMRKAKKSLPSNHHIENE